MAKAKKAAATKKVTLASKSKPVVSSKKSKKAAHIAPVASHKFASAKSSSNLVVKCLTLSTYALGIAAFIITACGLILPSNDDFSANGSLGFYKLVNATEPGESSTNTLNLIGILAIVFVALAFVSYITTLVLNLKAKGKFQLYSTIFIALVAVLFVLLISATIITSIPSVNVKFINFSWLFCVETNKPDASMTYTTGGIIVVVVACAIGAYTAAALTLEAFKNKLFNFNK